jgi:hypothetical protein
MRKYTANTLNFADAGDLLRQTIDKLRIDSGWLRMNSRQESDAAASRMLEAASNKIFKMSNTLERMSRTVPTGERRFEL